MKSHIRWLALLVLLAGPLNRLEATAPPAPSVFVGGHVAMFHGSLGVYGEWIEVDPGFYVWRPWRVRVGWRPYMEGRWVWTDYGWYWVSSEPFGWAVYHYGRWYHDDFYGWVWVPDDVWGPAWVDWRYNDDYIGWSPLPPYATFHITFGIRFTRHWVTPHHYWNFVPCNRFTGAITYRTVVREEYARRLIGNTRSGGRYEVERDRIVNRGIDRSFVEQRTRTTITRVDVRESGRDRGERIVREGGNAHVDVYRPSQEELTRAPERFEPRRGERKISLDVKQIERSEQPERRPESERSGNQEQSIEQRKRNVPEKIEPWKKPTESVRGDRPKPAAVPGQQPSKKDEPKARQHDNTSRERSSPWDVIFSPRERPSREGARQSSSKPKVETKKGTESRRERESPKVTPRPRPQPPSKASPPKKEERPRKRD